MFTLASLRPSALLRRRYAHGVSSKGAAFESYSASARNAAVAVARFAHKYNAPHALRHVDAYLRAFMDAHYTCKDRSKRQEGGCCTAELITWAILADNFELHKLCGQCERTLMVRWDRVQDKPAHYDRLSHGALRRIAKGLHATLLAEKSAGAKQGWMYPPVSDFIAWRQAA